MAFTASLTLLSLVSAPATASANICLYNPTPAGFAPVSGGGAIPAPWSGAIAAGPGCPMGSYTSSAATCAGSGLGVTGAYCDVTFSPSAPAGPLHQICTVYPSPGVTLTSVAAGWDLGGSKPGAPMPPPGSLTGPAAPPDGNLDGWDYFGPSTGASYTNVPGPTGEMTVVVYPPPFPVPTWNYQIIVYVGATSTLPAGLALPLTAACQ